MLRSIRNTGDKGFLTCLSAALLKVVPGGLSATTDDERMMKTLCGQASREGSGLRSAWHARGDSDVIRKGSPGGLTPFGLYLNTVRMRRMTI